jgi:type III pantothenate kinase
MTPDVVVDIGNSRMKWGVCRDNRVVEVIRLPLDDEAAWTEALARLPPPRAFDRNWAVASVNPPLLYRFLGWSYNHGGTAPFLDYQDLPIQLNVDEPDKVGIDRLLGAVAAKSMVPRGTPAITVDIGTAVTVNLVDAEGVFQGGAIFPGPALMSRSLHEYTASLPLIDVANLHTVSSLGRNTKQAIELGIQSAVGAALDRLIRYFTDQVESPPIVFFTGGGMEPFADIEEKGWTADPEFTRFIPTLNLEGIRIAAEALPGRRHE